MEARRHQREDSRLRLRHDTLLAVGLGLAVFAFLGWAFWSVASHTAAANRLSEGVITAKHFAPHPQPETELTVGGGELRRREVLGEYAFTVRVGERDWQVPVDEKTFAAHPVGDRFVFLRP